MRRAKRMYSIRRFLMPVYQLDHGLTQELQGGPAPVITGWDVYRVTHWTWAARVVRAWWRR